MPTEQRWFHDTLRAVKFLDRYPHFVGMIARLKVRYARAVEVMAIALERADRPEGTLHLYVNRNYFDENPEYFSGVLLHELHHAALGHLSRRDLHAIDDARAMEIAMEISANEFIADPLPEPIVWQSYMRIGVQPFQSTMDRYSLIRDAVRSGQLKLPNDCNSLDQHRVFGGARGKSEQGLGDALDRLSRDKKQALPDWELGLPTHEEDLLIMREMLEKHLGKRSGVPFAVNTGDGLKPRQDQRKLSEWESSIAPLNWPHLIRHSFSLKRRPKPTYVRPNRRFAHRLGEVPGRSRRQPKPELLVGIDTSGSMSERTLSAIAHEVSRLGHYAIVTIAECDAALHRKYRLSEALLQVLGGGDTDFTPVIADASTSDEEYEGVVYFTDGKGTWPLAMSEGAPPVLWVLTNDDPFDCPFGSRVRLLLHEQ